MAGSGLDSTDHFVIPTVNIANYVENPSSEAAEEVVNLIRLACITSGFFQITGHGISRQLQSEVFDASKAIFALPTYEKTKLEASMSGPGRDRGYEIIGSQTLQPGTLPDLKEGFYIGREDPSHLLAGSHRNFAGPNVWPPTTLIPDKKFKIPLSEYHERMCALSRTVFQILADGLPYGSGIFDEFCNDPVAVIRLLHYPPQPKSMDKKQLGAGAHTDFGAITLLLQNSQSGLQVLNYASNDWVDVPPNEDAYVVNVGDMLNKWTRGKYRSSVHRVVNRSPNDRYSVPFFFNGNLDCKLSAFDGQREAGTVITVEDHLKERFQSTYKS